MNERVIVWRIRHWMKVWALAVSVPAFAGSVIGRGVVVDDARLTAYLSSPQGGIAAVDLASGRSSWESESATLPLSIADGLLLAQVEERPETNHLRIDGFDVKAGARKVFTALVPLPEDVVPLIDDDARRGFRVAVTIDDNIASVTWTFTELPERGMYDVDQPPPRPYFVTGSSTIDLATGRVVETSEPVEDPGLIGGGGPKRPQWSAGTVRFSLQGGRGGSLTLQRWALSTGLPLPDRELSKAAIAALVSADQRHILASERVGDGTPDDPEYRWLVFSAESGEQIGSMLENFSAPPFLVAKDNLVFEAPARGFLRGEVWVAEPLSIRVVRSGNGIEIWQRPIRDHRYQGPLPPVNPRNRSKRPSGKPVADRPEGRK